MKNEPIAYAHGAYIRVGNRIKGTCFTKSLILPEYLDYDLSEGLGISKNIDGDINFDVKVKGWDKDPVEDDDNKTLKDLQAFVNKLEEG